jgi:sulfatase maturation enzyme AslB (radical SAM superfamily)
MPLSKDPKNGGTEKGGSKSELYCSYCYVDGEFTDGGVMDVREYQRYVMNIMKEKGMNGILAWLFTGGIPRLERWKKLQNNNK